MTKKTQRDFYNELLANPTITDEQREFLEGRIKQLDKKNSGGKKQTATQKENAEIKNMILTEMEEGVKYTVTDMIKNLPCCTFLSNQKVSALANQLEKDKLLVKTQENRKSYFELA